MVGQINQGRSAEQVAVGEPNLYQFNESPDSQTQSKLQSEAQDAQRQVRNKEATDAAQSAGKSSTVTLKYGDTIWDHAVKLYPKMNPSDATLALMEANGMPAKIEKRNGRMEIVAPIYRAGDSFTLPAEELMSDLSQLAKARMKGEEVPPLHKFSATELQKYETKPEQRQVQQTPKAEEPVVVQPVGPEQQVVPNPVSPEQQVVPNPVSPEQQVVPQPVNPEQQVVPQPVNPEQQVVPQPVVPEQQVVPQAVTPEKSPVSTEQQQMINVADALTKDYRQTVEHANVLCSSQGWLGQSFNFLKNHIGTSHSSSKGLAHSWSNFFDSDQGSDYLTKRAAEDSARIQTLQDVAKSGDQQAFAKTYEELTGQKFTPGKQATLKLASEVQKYNQSQATGVDVEADFVSTAVALAALRVPALRKIPAIATAATVGAVSKAGSKSLDGNYANLGYDLGTGALINGLIPLTGGLTSRLQGETAIAATTRLGRAGQILRVGTASGIGGSLYGGTVGAGSYTLGALSAGSEIKNSDLIESTTRGALTGFGFGFVSGAGGELFRSRPAVNNPKETAPQPVKPNQMEPDPWNGEVEVLKTRPVTNQPQEPEQLLLTGKPEQKMLPGTGPDQKLLAAGKPVPESIPDPWFEKPSVIITPPPKDFVAERTPLVSQQKLLMPAKTLANESQFGQPTVSAHSDVPAVLPAVTIKPVSLPSETLPPVTRGLDGTIAPPLRPPVTSPVVASLAPERVGLVEKHLKAAYGFTDDIGQHTPLDDKSITAVIKGMTDSSSLVGDAKKRAINSVLKEISSKTAEIGQPIKPGAKTLTPEQYEVVQAIIAQSKLPLKEIS